MAELASKWVSWRCQAPGYEGVAFSPAYVEQYCLTARHAECRIFKRFGGRTGVLAYKPQGLEPPEWRAEPTAREKVAGMASQQADALPAIYEAARQEAPAPFTIDISSETVTPNHERKKAMLEVQQASLVSMETGTEIRIDMQVGHQKVVVTSGVDDVDGGLKQVLERLVGKIQEVTFVRTPAGGEIRATVQFGERSYESSWAIEEAEGEPVIGDLLDQLGRASLANVQLSLENTSVREADSLRARYQGDRELAQQDGGDDPGRSWDTSRVAPPGDTGTW